MNLARVSGDVRIGRFNRPPLAAERRSWRGRTLDRLPLLLVVVLPALLASVYYFTVAADQYASEASFVVRNVAGNRPRLETAGVMEGASVSTVGDDTYAVQEYLMSRDALRTLMQTVDVRAIFSRPEADGLAAFPPGLPILRDQTTFEHLYKYYLRHVNAEIDHTTGVSKLWVKTFRPEDSALIARTLLGAGEKLVDRINDRQRENALRDSGREVGTARARVEAAANKLAEFRTRVALLSPESQSVTLLKTISELEVRQTQLRVQVEDLTRSSPQSPLIAVNQQRIDILQGQINGTRAQVTGSDRSMVPKLTEYDALMFDKALSDRRLAFASAALDAARVRATQQQVYLDTVSQPNSPDHAAYPKRFLSIGIVFAVSFAVYVIGRLPIAAIREHMAMFRLRAGW